MVRTVSATSLTDPNTHVVRWCIDALGRAVRSFDGRGKQRSASFTANSDVTSYTSGTGAADVTNYSTDGLNNPIGGTTGPGAAWSMTYAAPGQPYLPSTSTDAQGKSTNMRYDPNGDVCSMNNGATAPPDCTTGVSGSGQLRMARGAATAPGAISAITDGRGHTTTLAYNSLGELTSVTPPDTTTLGARSFTYDSLSRVATVTDGKGQVTTYTYDPLDRVTSIAYQGGATVSWTYDAAGNRATMTDQAGATTYGYDALQRLTSEAKPVAEGGTNTYTYDPVGNMLTLTNAGETVTYAYDAADNAQTITEPGGNTTTLAYNDNEQLSTTTFPTATGVVETRTYEGDRLARVRATKGSTVITDFGYCYRDPVSACGTTGGTVRDLVSRMQDLAEGDTTAYTYDNLGRLTGATTTGTHPRTDVYGYDDASNRTMEQSNDGPIITSVFNPNNQLTSRGTTTYSFDKNGNRTGSSAGEAYAYNSKDQATTLTASVTLAGVAYAGPGQGERYQVNSTSYTNDTLGTGAEATGATTTRYTRNPDTGGAPLGIRQGAGRWYVLGDQQASVAKVIDSTGATAAFWRRNAYGVVLASGGTPINSWGFHGTYLDATGLNKMGARYYDSATGAFTQTEPLKDTSALRGIIDYTYAAGDPINQTDPLGEYWGESKVNWAGRFVRRRARACVTNGAKMVVAGFPIYLAAPETAPSAVPMFFSGCSVGAIFG